MWPDFVTLAYLRLDHAVQYKVFTRATSSMNPESIAEVVVLYFPNFNWLHNTPIYHRPQANGQMLPSFSFIKKNFGKFHTLVKPSHRCGSVSLWHARQKSYF